MTVDLDTRMRSAGDSLVRASERLSPAAPPRSLRPLAGAVAGVVAVVALAAGTAAVLAVDDGGGGGESTVASGSAVARLVPDVVADRLRSLGVVELPDDADRGPEALSISVYGDPAADDPFARADLALYTTAVPVEPVQLDQLGDTEPVTVRGHTGFADEYMPEGVLLIWQEAPGLSIGMGSRTLDLGQLQAIAEGLVVDADTRTVEVGPLPDGIAGTLAPVGSVDDFAASPALAPLVPPIPAAGDGHLAVYQPDEYGAFGAAFVAEFAGDANDLAVVRWMSGAGTATEVRGHLGWAGSYELPPFDDGEGIVPGSEGLFVATLVWEEAPGVLVLVQTMGPDEDDARAMAESLRPATEDEWARLIRLGRGSDILQSDEERVAAGQLPVQDRLEAATISMPERARNGAEGVYGVAGVWATWIESDGTLCGAVDTVDDNLDAVETCDPEGGPATTVHDHDGRPVLLIGVMPDGAVGRYPTDGEIEEAQTVSGPDDAPPYYVMAIADGAAPSAVTFVDADGTEMTTVPVDP